jgi:hydroxymethylbilane synthase
VQDGTIRMTALVASEDGREVLRGSADGVADDAEGIGLRLAEALLERGAASVAALHAGDGRDSGRGEAAGAVQASPHVRGDG